MRFVDTNVFIYVITNHPRFAQASTAILERIEEGEKAATSTLVLCEVAWVLEAMGKMGSIRDTLEKIMSYSALEVCDFDSDDLVVGANLMAAHRVDFNDGVNLAIMERLGINEVYSNDEKHLGRLSFIQTIFE